MKRLSLLALVFALLSAVFFLLLVFFRIPFPPYPLISYQDALDLLTPLVLIPVYWLLFKNANSGESGRLEELIFMVLAAAWVMGQGMHLSANSVNNLAEGLAKDGKLDILDTTIYELAYFFDEYLSHYFWHVGLLGLGWLVMVRDWRRSTDIQTRWWAAFLGGLIYGFTLFAIFLEGQTTLIGFPAAVVITLVTLIGGRRKLGRRPLIAFFFVSFLVASLLFAGWGLYWGGFPQFTDVGLI